MSQKSVTEEDSLSVKPETLESPERNTGKALQAPGRGKDFPEQEFESPGNKSGELANGIASNSKASVQQRGQWERDSRNHREALASSSSDQGWLS